MENGDLMRILFLNLASHQGCLACVADDRVVAFDSIDHRIDDARLIPHVEDVLLKAQWSYKDLTHIACVVGPGGFTSLRVAVALTNALSHELTIPSCGVHLSEIYESRIMNHESGERRSTLWLHSTKKHELFIRGFGTLAQTFPEPVCITVDDLRKIITKDIQWMGELIPEHQAVIAEAGAEPAPLLTVDHVLPALLRSQNFQSQTLLPWYGRGW